MPEPATQRFPLDPLHCDQCGAPLVTGDDRGATRPRCPVCERWVFRNPTVGVAVLVRDDAGRVLMVKRADWATQPGKWSLPAGFMDYGEDVREAGAREVREETGLSVELGEVIHVATTHHDRAKLGVCLWFEAVRHEGTPVASDDAVDVGWFALDDLPELAFETDEAVFAGLR